MASTISESPTACGAIKRIQALAGSANSLIYSPEGYAQKGQWYDAMTALQTLIQDKPGNADLLTHERPCWNKSASPKPPPLDNKPRPRKLLQPQKRSDTRTLSARTSSTTATEYSTPLLGGGGGGQLKKRTHLFSPFLFFLRTGHSPSRPRTFSLYFCLPTPGHFSLHSLL